MAYGFPYPQPPVPNYFNTNYMPPQLQPIQQQQPVQQVHQIQQASAPTLISVPDELTARNAQFPMDGSPVYFINVNNQEIYSKQLSMANGSVIWHRYRRDPENKTAEPAYVTREELDAKIEELYQLLDPASAKGGDAK